MTVYAVRVETGDACEEQVILLLSLQIQNKDFFSSSSILWLTNTELNRGLSTNTGSIAYGKLSIPWSADSAAVSP